MILFNHDTDEGDFKVDNNTKNFCIALFGFFPHSKAENIDYFFKKELKLKLVETDYFCFNKGFYCIPYNVVDRRTFDHSFIIGNIFKDKKSAKKYINEKIKHSEHITTNYFDEIIILDADKISNHLESVDKKRKELKEKKDIVNNEFNKFKEYLIEKYKDDEILIKLIQKK